MTQPYMMSVDISIGRIPSELISFCDPFVPQSDPQIIEVVRNHPLAPCASCTYPKAAHIGFIKQHRGVSAPLLAPREEQTLRLLLRGYTIQEAADELYVSLSTAKTYVKTLYQKFQVNNRVALANAARAAGFSQN